MQKFQQVIEELITLFQGLIELETIKLRAAAEKRASGVEECITKEQAMILKLKGLEKDREREQEACGYKDCTFQEILERVSEIEKQSLLPLFEELSREIQMFQEISQDTFRMLGVNIRQIQNTLSKRGGLEGTVYSENGFGQKQERHMTNRKA